MANLAHALDRQCRRAGRLLEDEPGVPPDLRTALLGMAARAREAADRAPALLAPPPAAPSSRQNPSDTRECAFALALTMKLDGAASGHVENWLRDEFGRSDAKQITDEAFGSA